MSARTAFLPASRSGQGGEYPEGIKFRVFSWIFVGASTLILAASVVWLEFDPQLAWQAAAWTIISSLAGLVPLRSEGGPSLSLDLPLLLGAGFVFGPAMGGLVAFFGATDIREFKRDISLTRGLFNRAQTATCVALGAAAFQWTGGEIGWRWPFVLFPTMVALSVDSLANYTLVAAGTALRTRMSFAAAARAMKVGSTQQFLLSYLSLGLLSLVFATVYVSAGLWGLVISVVPLILAWQAFSRAKQLDEADRIMVGKARALREMSSELMNERKDERTRIAASLHDDVLQSLYNVALHTHVIREDLRGGRLLELDEDLPALLTAAERASDGLRVVIRDLRQSSLGRAGLADTLRLLVRDLQEHSDACFQLRLGKVSLEPEAQLLLYQIAREAITNSCKHAKPKTITVRLASVDDRVQVSIEDDGEGFDPSQVKDDHFGLQMMQERAAVMGGYLRVDSTPGLGTTIVALVPVPARGND